jgi:hypothetical protein
MITLRNLPEPRLLFAKGEHVCPRRGIAEFGVYDRVGRTRRSEVLCGGVGTGSCLEALSEWVLRCKGAIHHEGGADATRHPNLHPPFCGMTTGLGFDVTLSFAADLARPIKESEIKEIEAIEALSQRHIQAVELYYDHVKFLAQNRHVDVIVCVVPEALFKALASPDEVSLEPTLDDDGAEPVGELNFRRAVKARCMHLGKPLQLVREKSLGTHVRGQQNDATKAWNFCTALYYKSGPTVPWKLVSDSSRGSLCAVGIAFYRSRDLRTLSTSLAQIFDELGNGLILRGTPVDLDKDDLRPYMTDQQAFDLLSAALQEYHSAMGNYPARLVLHKSSRFRPEEIDGFVRAADAAHVNTTDFLRVSDSRLRLYRNGNYPPYRGTLMSIDAKHHVLYSRGSVPWYQTYPGLYVPQPIELQIERSDESPQQIARELLGLTKMNWNNTQFDGKYPVTLGSARKVGEILKYLEESERPQARYAFYM